MLTVLFSRYLAELDDKNAIELGEAFVDEEHVVSVFLLHVACAFSLRTQWLWLGT